MGSHAGRLAAVCLATGSEIWCTQLPDRIEASCAVSADGATLFVGGYDEHLHAVRRSDGVRLWSRRARGVIKGGAICLPDLGRDLGGDGGADCGALLSGCFGGALVALTPTSGRLLWEYRCGSALFARPVVDGRRRHVYVVDLRGCIHCVRYYVSPSSSSSPSSSTASAVASVSPAAAASATMAMASPTPPSTSAPSSPASSFGFELAWRRSLGQTVALFASPALADDAVLLGGVDGRLRALSGASGEMLWEMDLGGAIFATPCIAASLGADEGTHCFATCQTGRLHCIRAADGQPRWTTAPAKFEGHASPAVETAFAHVGPRLGSSMVCAAATDGSLHLFRSSDGLPVLASPLKLPAPIFSSPVLCARRVVVGCRDDALYCIHMESFR